ncbi:MAG: PorP/SprF family type IX secretion system membrane protein [Flavobacteriales bacterium]|nr:PorP/SprF family type IX secretion system membrane protein [Flavobacteriales bacterium]
MISTINKTKPANPPIGADGLASDSTSELCTVCCLLLQSLSRLSVVALVVSILLFSSLSVEIAAQDVHFSQFNASPLLINPASAGSFDGDQRAVINYKSQWSSISNPFITYALGFDMPILKEKITQGSLGAGFTAYSDKAGDTQIGNSQLNLIISYHASLDEKNTLSSGIQAGFGQRSINGASLRWGNQDNGINGFDPNLSSGETSELNNFSYGDFAGGIMWSYRSSKTNFSSNDGFRSNLGASFFHINQPGGAFYEGAEEQLYLKMVVHGYLSAPVKNTNTAVQPSILILQQGPSRELLVGAMVRYQIKENSKYTGLKKGAAISIGGHYRFGDAFIPAVRFEYSSFDLGFSYDINVSGLTEASGGQGGAEISLRFINPNPFRSRVTNPSFN